MGGKTPIGPNVSLVAIIYSKALGHVRQHVYAEASHAEYDWVAKFMCPGEAMCFVDRVHHEAGHDTFYQAIRDSVKAHGGVDAILWDTEPAAAAHRWVQVDPVTKVVTHVTMADPAIDNVRQGPDHKTLDEMGYVNVPADHPRVDVGHIHDPATNTFSNPRAAVHPSKLK